MEQVEINYHAWVATDLDLHDRDKECDGVYGVDVPSELQELIGSVPDGSRNKGAPPDDTTLYSVFVTIT